MEIVIFQSDMILNGLDLRPLRWAEQVEDHLLEGEEQQVDG